MDISTWLHQILTGSPLPTSLGVQIYPVVARQGTVGFYATYELVSSPPILAQDDNSPGASRDTQTWDYQFKIIGPTLAGVASKTEELRAFLTSYSDRQNPSFLSAGGIQRIIETNTRDLSPAPDTRNFIRLLEVNIMENLA